MDLAITIVLVMVSVMVTTAFHYEALRLLMAFRRLTPRSTVMAVLAGLIAVHFIEITMYALVFSIAAGPLDLGSFGDDVPGFVTMLYFAAETYATLGYGDIVPTGDLRLIAGAEALNGLLLLAWSGSALFILVQDRAPLANRSAERKNEVR